MFGGTEPISSRTNAGSQSQFTENATRSVSSRRKSAVRFSSRRRSTTSIDSANFSRTPAMHSSPSGGK